MFRMAESLLCQWNVISADDSTVRLAIGNATKSAAYEFQFNKASRQAACLAVPWPVVMLVTVRPVPGIEARLPSNVRLAERKN